MKTIRLTQVSNLPKRSSGKLVVPTEDQILIYISLVKILRPYIKLMRVQLSMRDRFIVETQNQFEVWTVNPEKNNSKYPGVLFAAASIRQETVGFYFFPLVVCPELREEIPGDKLIHLLNSASVFHITEIDAQLIEEIKNLLDIGVKYYRKIGWI